MAAALAAAVPALGLIRTAEELARAATPLSGRGASLNACLEAIAGRAVSEDELMVAEEAFADHLAERVLGRGEPAVAE